MGSGERVGNGTRHSDTGYGHPREGLIAVPNAHLMPSVLSYT